LLHDEGFLGSNNLNEALVLVVPIVRVSNAIGDMFSKFYMQSMLKIVSPAIVRHFLKDYTKLATSQVRKYFLMFL
jgi:sacsin